MTSKFKILFGFTSYSLVFVQLSKVLSFPATLGGKGGNFVRIHLKRPYFTSQYFNKTRRFHL